MITFTDRPYHVDPLKVTCYGQSRNQLELFVLFWVAAAGKNGVTAANAVSRLLTDYDPTGLTSPFGLILQNRHRLARDMRRAGIGCFNLKAKTFQELANSGIDLGTCSRQVLTSFKGVGMKTASCFVAHSRPDVQVSCLDRHVLSWLGDLGYNVPSSTPTGRKYEEVERHFLAEAVRRKRKPADLDLAVWLHYSKKEDRFDELFTAPDHGNS